MREIIFDTETTGFEPDAGHRIVEIGCVEMVHKLRTGKSFHYYINPLRDVPAEATAVHGITSEFLLDKPVFSDIVEPLLTFLGTDSLLVAHNASFDMKFLNHALKSHGHRTIDSSRVIDTLDMARKKFPGSPATLDALCRRFSIDLSRRDKHGALLDAELLAEVYIELCGGRQVGIDFTQPASVVTTPLMPEPAPTYTHIEERPAVIFPQELAAHQALIASIPGAVWQEYSDN